MLLDEAAVGEAIAFLKRVGGAAFFHERHRLIFEQIATFYDRGQPLDAVVLKDHLERAGLLEQLGGLEYLGQLVNAVPSADRVLHYGEIVRDKYLLRLLITAAHHLIEKSFDDREEIADVLDEAERKVFEITQQRITSDATDLHALVERVFKQIEQRDGEAITGAPTGYYELDELTCGMQPSELIIVAARPSVGKTALGLNMAEHLAITERRPVLFFSLEMSKQQLAQRVLCSRARVDAHRLRRGRITADEMQRLHAAADETRGAPLHVDDSSDLTVRELQARARTVYHRQKFCAIFVDYLQLMRGSKAENRQVAVADISRGLKALAKQLEVPVVALAQLNRNPEDRGGKPRMSDLRESGAIEQDADVIILLHRESYQRDTDAQAAPAEDDNLAELLIAKQRNGPVGRVTLHFNKQYTRFDNHSPGRYPDGGGSGTFP